MMGWFKRGHHLERQIKELQHRNNVLLEKNDDLRSKIARQAQIIHALRLVFDHAGFDVNIEDVEIYREEDEL